MAETRRGLVPPRRLRSAGRPRHDGPMSADYTRLPDDLPEREAGR
jgi:hypothetical protein